MKVTAPNIQMLNDPDGKTSFTRVAYFLLIVFFMGTWSILSIKNGAMQSIEPEWIGIFLVFAGQKTGQSFAEHDK